MVRRKFDRAYQVAPRLLPVVPKAVLEEPPRSCGFSKRGFKLDRAFRRRKALCDQRSRRVKTAHAEIDAHPCHPKVSLRVVSRFAQRLFETFQRRAKLA